MDRNFAFDVSETALALRRAGRKTESMMKEGTIKVADAQPADHQPLGTTTVVEAPPKKNRLRLILLLSVPLVILAIGAWFYLTSGRYVSTDNAYVQQDKISVSAEVTGRIVEVNVKENQRVRAADLLYRLDPAPFRIAPQ